MSDNTEVQNYLKLAVSSDDRWLKDRALQRASNEITRLQEENTKLWGWLIETEQIAVQKLGEHGKVTML